eukprot:231190_1
MQPEATETPTETGDPSTVTSASVLVVDQDCVIDSRLRVRSSSELSEGDNTRNNDGTVIDSIAFSPNLSNFYLLHTLKCADQTRGDTLKFIGLTILCLLVVTVQFVSLYMLSFAFQYWANPFYVEYGTSGVPGGAHGHMAFDMFGQLYPDPYTYGLQPLHMAHQQYTYRNSLTPSFKEDTRAYFDYDMSVLVPTFDVFVWFVTVFTLILCGLLSKSIRSSVSSAWICFCYDDDRYPRTAYYFIMAMFLKTLNLALLFCVFAFIVNTICFVLYFGLAIAMDWRVFLFPIAAICVVRFDEWVFNWTAVVRPHDFWSVRVTKHYGKTHTKLVTWFVCMYISWAFAWYLSSNPVYFWNDSGTYYFNSYKLITLAALCGAMLLLFPMNPSTLKRIMRHFVGDLSVMILSFAAAVVMHYGPTTQSYSYEVEWSKDLLAHVRENEEYHYDDYGLSYAWFEDSFDTYRAPLSPERSITFIKLIAVIAMVFCGLNFVLFICELSGKSSLGKYRIFVSVIPPLMCLASYIYCLAEFGLTILNPATQSLVLFTTPLIIALYVGNWKQMWMNVNMKPYSKPYGWSYVFWYVIGLGFIIIYVLKAPGFFYS